MLERVSLLFSGQAGLKDWISRPRWQTCGAGLLAIRGVGVAWRETRVESFFFSCK